jgi:hypothetical protein
MKTGIKPYINGQNKVINKLLLRSQSKTIRTVTLNYWGQVSRFSEDA